MQKKYWFINYDTKEYFKAEETPQLFDGEWIKRTPWPEIGYAQIDIQSDWPHQRISDHCFYDYDLCSSGGLFGLYYDKNVHTKEQMEQVERQLRHSQDVVSLFHHPLTRAQGPNDALDQLQQAAIAGILLDAGDMLTTLKMFEPLRKELLNEKEGKELRQQWESVAGSPELMRVFVSQLADQAIRSQALEPDDESRMGM